jgi:hypothetical protein
METDGDNDARSEAERRLLELLRLLADEGTLAPDPVRHARLLRRARFQRDLRPALVVGAGLAAAMLEACAPLIAPAGPGGGA